MNSKSSPSPKKVCIFDFDGTLVDSMGGFADLAAILMNKAYGLALGDARKKYLKTSGLPFFQQLESLFPGHGANKTVASNFEKQKQQQYWDRPFFCEVPAAIKDLQESGVRVVISSNNGQEIVEEFLEKQPHPKPNFDLVLGFREGFAKGPAHFEKVLDHFEVSHEEALFIGDSLHDAQKALHFGLDFVGRAGTFTKQRFEESYPDLPVVTDLTELVEVVCK